ncbi:MAG TPA: hypothetical protein ENK04_09455 [Gammaproteobacteria bacterium]|nr:hypothetical protein [Gammaproteobacteria bacterium]
MQMIKKNMVALAVAGALVSPLTAMADDAEVSGFIDVFANSDSNPVFTADAEVDVSKKVGAVTVRVDMDANLAANGGGSYGGEDSGRLEQAFFAWAATEQVTVLGGLFNNPIGQELEDAPDMEFSSHSTVWKILDNQTALYGNNLAGIAAAVAAGPATVTLAVVDDLGLATNNAGDKGKTSAALVVNATPMAGLDLELGYVSQDDQEVANTPTTAGNVLDFNAAFKTGPVTVGLDYLAADNLIDSAANLWAGFAVNDKLNLKARYETVALEGGGIDDPTKTTVYATYAINSNLSAALEYSTGSNDDTSGVVSTVTGIVDDDVTTLEFIGRF